MRYNSHAHVGGDCAGCSVTAGENLPSRGGSDLMTKSVPHGSAVAETWWSGRWISTTVCHDSEANL